MMFYSGFSFKNESMAFSTWLKDDTYTVAGFSYGAIKAFEHVCASGERVDTLQLFSPAFFQDKPSAFKRMQQLGYKKDPGNYIEQFTSLCFQPLAVQGGLERTQTSARELQELLEYEWDEDELQALVQRGVDIEVYLGGNDAVINSKAAREFFVPHATVYYINRANHFLEESKQ
jgi:hypothetical protein